ncbi:hypothetical protein H072_10853 [Dactylellina haptotyla CBS 200.50]|uniref:Uncharacterized protein n=1 Tax=Dactylellina haptotyla (strain CBS 200.50) TaxID=1284197 RepID=S8A3I1_DACHA|nr:hypothetical protein H072_10853 [Dactylellina haptotyla CBS 200.50]
MAEHRQSGQSYALQLQTDSLSLQDPKSKLRVKFTASVSTKLPHKTWTIRERWRCLAVEGSQNVLLDVKLLWKSGALQREGSPLCEALGQVLSQARFWEQLDLVASLEMPSHDHIKIKLNSKNYTSLPQDLCLPTIAVLSINWAFDFTPCPHMKFIDLQLRDIQPLVEECIDTFLNNKLGASNITGGMLNPGTLQQTRSAMPSIEAITSTLARYAAQCGDYGQFKTKMMQLKDKVGAVGLVAEEAVDLQNVIKGQVYHQILRALQIPRFKKKHRFRSESNSENELLCKPLERFQDLFARTGSLILSKAGDDCNKASEAEDIDFEDLFEEEDNYSDFEDLIKEAKKVALDEASDDMTPDSPKMAVCLERPSDSQFDLVPHSIQNDYDMTSECSGAPSEIDFVMLDDSTAGSTELRSAVPIENEYDDCFASLDGHPSASQSSSSIERVSSSDENQQLATLWANEEFMQMLF